MMKKEYRFRARDLFCLSAIILATAILAGACESPAISRGSKKTSDLKLSFEAPEPKSSASISPLILPSASTLTVSLTPLDPGLDKPDPKSISIVSDQAVSVSFDALEYGDYTIRAVASDPGGNARFQASSAVAVSDSTPPVTMTLMPTGSTVDTASITSSNNQVIIGDGTLAANSTVTYQIPADVWNASYDYYYLDIYIGTGTTIGFRFYVQDADGNLLSKGEVDNTGIVSATTYLIMTNAAAEVTPA